MRTRWLDALPEGLAAHLWMPDFVTLEAVAIVLGIYWAMRRAESVGLDPAAVFRAGVFTIAFAFTGARLYSVVEHFSYYADHPAEALFFWNGGMVSYGAYAGGFVGALLAARWQQLPRARFLDCCALPMAAGMVLGRVGCFLNGCCFGAASSLPWALSFPPGSPAHDQHLRLGVVGPEELSLAVHPTQLYEALFGLALLLVLAGYRASEPRAGHTFNLFFILYPLGRFLNELLRADDRGTFYFLSQPQLVSIIVCGLALVVLVTRAHRGRVAPALPSATALAG